MTNPGAGFIRFCGRTWSTTGTAGCQFTESIAPISEILAQIFFLYYFILRVAGKNQAVTLSHPLSSNHPSFIRRSMHAGSILTSANVHFVFVCSLKDDSEDKRSLENKRHYPIT